MLSFKRGNPDRPRKSPPEIVGLDLGTTGVKAVRMRRGKDGVTVLKAEILPPLVPAEVDPKSGRPPLPRSLLTHYAALALSGAHATVRILGIPGRLESGPDRDVQVREHAGVGEGQRMGYAIMMTPKLRNETRLLVVTLPEEEAQSLLNLFASGSPAPFSLELAGLAAITAFLRGPGHAHEQGTVGLVESGERQTTMALLHHNLPVLVRKFDLGMYSVRERVQQRLGVDAETARGVLADGSFDISQTLHEVVDPFLRQLSLSKEFIERREECQVEKFYVSGGMSLSRFWVSELKQAAGVAVERWNPFDGLKLAPEAMPPALEDQQTRFTAAVGCCLGAWESP
jgi:Tfp pilus assembly PilM family ATPase